MAIVRAQEALSFTPRYNYDVFLSFRGEDTRKTFTDHLYEALSGGAGLRTFRDDEGIERGENVNSELEKAIKAARSSIIVFSKDYASSKWCLDEVVMILEHKRTSGHVILPVFFDVDPCQVKHQTGSFAEAFGRHEELIIRETDETKRKCLTNKVEVWRKALQEVADLAGMDLRNDANGFESILIKKIIKEIGSKLDHPVLHVAPYLIGMEYRVENINLWLRDESSSDGIVVICGVGGIGKTTIAKYVYNLNFKRFDGSSFLANIRETSEQHNGLVGLQRQLLSNIFKGRENISNFDEGIIRIENALRCKKVFVVLDDVDQRYQLDALIGMHKQFHPGSKIIVTARNKNLLKQNEVFKIYEVENFNDEESLELFSWHAFGQDHPKKEYYQHSKKVVRCCGGLPLALQVLGSSLFGKNIAIWESASQKLAVIPNSKILQKLKISYDSLEDDDTKRLFLYIAGFFIGEGKDFVVKILDSCGFFTIIGMENLIDRCLLAIDEPKKLSMHQLLQDMAKEIVRQESPKEPGNRSLLLHHEDSFNVLTNKSGTKTIEGLYLDMHVLENSGWFNRTFGTRDTKQPRFEEHNGVSLLADQGNSLKRRCLSFIHWFPIKNAAINSNEVLLKTDAFFRMPELRLLKLNSVEMKGGFKEFPKELRWLSWHRFSLKSIPSDFPMESLVALDLSHSKLEHVWTGMKLLKSLKILNLSHCHGLTNTLNFTVCPNLEDLILEDCIHLVKVHESIGGLKKLVSLNLQGCKNLKNLPSEFHCLTSLRTLNMSGCSKLEHVWTGMKLLKSLKILNLSHCHGLTNTPNFIVCPNLEDLILEDCIHLVKVPESLATLPHSLVTLNLSKCSLSSDGLARSLGSLSLLQDLNLSMNPISNIPESIKYLTMLKSLKLDSCKRLQSVPELPKSLTLLSVHNCSSLQMVTSVSIMFTNLSMHICEKLVEVQGIFTKPIRNVKPEIIKHLALDLVKLESMRSLDLKYLNEMTGCITNGPIQVLYECGIYSTLLPRSWFRDLCCDFKRIGSDLSFHVPSPANHKIQALNVYILYAFPSDKLSLFEKNYLGKVRHHVCYPYVGRGYVDIVNWSKDMMWRYWPVCYNVSYLDQDWLWSIHWKSGHQVIIEGGDEIVVVAVSNEHCNVKEVGVQIVWDEDEVNGRQHHTNVDLSPYLDQPGKYFLAN
ncbi:LOW QUALITY PROTEIN: disease resistance protein RPV1-like [Actinidia eriantha]|uniref:LOW QUALITY PROTEIN: disease resistance protein RPV1-like n=1 Tax=Actinidia eriantha TaxID=165200 RepID=UPI00258E43D2|nr:LOW QUALITY PROTEIN: disease resistance protein RPV1-like [Actinidia eriantha]